jgi:GNAT superfamily N-acetyltransferase
MEPEPQVARLGSEWYEEVVDTLCESFYDYPVMRYVLKDAGSDYDARLTRLLGYFTDSRFSRGWPVLGVIRQRRLLAAANINPPHGAPQPPSLRQRYEQLCQELGRASIARFEAFANACAPLEPNDPHYNLGMLGVRRECQGRGYARLLLDAVHEMSARDPDSTGVVLTTETPDNLPFYERFGYRVVGHAQVDELQTWTLLRPDLA